MRRVFLMVLGLSAAVWAANGDMGVGTEPLTDGSADYPWLIEDVNDFDAFAGNSAYWAVGVHTQLMTDIDLSGKTYTTAVIAPDTSNTTSGFQGTKYTGSLDGNNHVISNLTITASTKDYIGLFGYVSTGCQVKNLGIETVNLAGDEFVGGLAGYQYSGSLSNCYGTGEVCGNRYIGGLEGYIRNGTITLCYANSLVDGIFSYVGGLVAFNDGGSIINSYATGATGNVTGSASQVGGLVGQNYGSISHCHALGAVKSTDGWIGGLVGLNENGNISDCYATGQVDGGDYVGGLVGSNNGSCSISASYATGVVNGRYTYIGGLVGANLISSISDSYATGAVNGLRVEFSNFVGGLVGRNSGSIHKSNATGDVTAKCDYVGGLAGSNSGTITNSCATGQVDGDSFVSGLVGDNSGSITSCYATGQIDGDEYVGGVMGRNINGSITSCYAACAVNGDMYVGGLVGRHHSGNITSSYFYIYGGPNNNHGTPLDDGQLQDSDSFVGFDFTGSSLDGNEDIWSIEAGYMPRLSWQVSPGIEVPYRLDNITTTLSGTGYPDDPFNIADYNDLMEFRNNSQLRSGFYSLNCDIDLAGITPYSVAFIPQSFQGSFDGNGHVISNLTIDGGSNLGFFSFLFGSVDSLGLENASVTGFSYVAILAGYNEGSINSSYATGTVHGFYTFGGLVGCSFGGSIASCYATSTVTASGGAESSSVGGLVGVSSSGSINACYATGSVYGGHANTGGLVGSNSSSISASYATGAVSGAERVGGLVGSHLGSISSSYATGEITGMLYVGGLAGINNNGSILSSFWDVETSGIGSTGDDNYGATGKTTAEMKTKSTFTNTPASWDFVGEDVNGVNEIWRICVDGMDYPRLSWKFAQNGDFSCGDGVDILDLQVLAEHWLMAEVNNPDLFNYACDANGDREINFEDLSVLSKNWRSGGLDDAAGGGGHSAAGVAGGF